jgi:hypothetical protein
MTVRGEICWPSAGTFAVRPRGLSVAVYGEFGVAAVTMSSRCAGEVGAKV